MGIKVLSDKQKKYHKLKSKHSKAVKNIVKRKAKLFTNNSTSLLLKGESSCKDDFNGTKQSSINKYLNGNTLIQKEDKSPSIRNKINRITKKLKIISELFLQTNLFW